MQTTIFPTMRYQDAPKAINWLCDVLEFKRKVVYESDGLIVHAQLSHGSGLIMMSSVRNSPFDDLSKIPKDIDGYNTQSCYLFVEDLALYYSRIKDRGAEIVLPLKKEDHGSGFTCRDPEGYLWNFGDYNPFVNDEPTD